MRALLCALGSAAAAGAAEVVTEGTLAVGGGGALLRGSESAFQEIVRQRKDGAGGLEDFSLTRTTDAAMFRVDARLVPGNADYALAATWEQFDAWFATATFRRFRTFTDGAGGELLPFALALPYFPTALALDDTFITFELGNLQRDAVRWRLRYDRMTRTGTKNSIRWGDSNLGGPLFSPRAFIPSYLVADETQDAVTLEASEKTETANWQATARYQRTKLRNRHVARRRLGEPENRYVTMRDGTESNQVSGHASYERIFHERLRASAGGLVTTIDTHLAGNRIYGATPDAEYSARFSGLTGDGGYYGLTGNTQLKQYVGNLNVHYQPTERLAFLPAVKYEHLQQDSGETHTDVAFTTGAANAAERNLEARSRNGWDEVTGDLEARYQRWADWSLSLRGQWNRGTGNLVEHSILRTNGNDVLVHRSDYERQGQRYLAGATWYARPGLTFGAQYQYRLKRADYTGLEDSTANTGASRDRYPQFILDQDLASHDAHVRVSWRPKPSFSTTFRYAQQRSTVTTEFDGLGTLQNGHLRRHVLTTAATWNATARLYVTGAFNLTFDQLRLPPHRLAITSDNNYTNASLAAGYALGKVTDVYLDASTYHAGNYTNNPEVTLPLNSGQTLESGFLTWVRRHSERLVYTAKYGYVTNRDLTQGGQKDFRAHVLYAKVQLKF